MLHNLVNRGALAHAAIPAAIGFIASKMAILANPAIALRWAAPEAALFIFANSLLQVGARAFANKFAPEHSSRQHKIIVHLLPSLIAIATCTALGATIAKINALVGVYHFITSGYNAFEPNDFFQERVFGKQLAFNRS